MADAYPREGRIAMLQSIAIRLLRGIPPIPAFPARMLLPALGLGFLVNCGGSTGTSPDASRESGNLASPAQITLSLGKVGVLSKTSAIHLRKLVLTAVSQTSPADTVRDTSRVSGSEAQTVQRVVGLKPLVAWIVSARTLDQHDSVIHAGETPPFTVEPTDTSRVSLALASRFVMYQALFGDLPDSVASPGSALRTRINLNRLVLRIDGAVRADSVLPGDRYFRGGQDVALHFDYVTPGSHAVVLEAYGAMEGWSGLMFSGSATFSSTAGQDGSRPVTLRWVGPTTGGGEVTLILGHIGKVTVVGGFNPML